MRRLARWTLNAVTVLSLLLCVAVAVMWVRGYWQWAVVGWNAPRNTPTAFTDRFIGFSSSDGKIVLVWRDLTWLLNNPAAGRLSANWQHGYFFAPYNFFVREDLANRRPEPYSSRDPTDRTKCITFPGGFLNLFDKPATTTQRGLSGFDLVVPAAPVCAVLATGPTVAFIRRRRKRRPANPGSCASCSYDLTGNVSGVCPECGTAICTTEPVYA